MLLLLSLILAIGEYDRMGDGGTELEDNHLKRESEEEDSGDKVIQDSCDEADDELSSWNYFF
jgi:hypothetical protein